MQLGFARSVDPIMPQEVTITRVAITTEADAEKKDTEMGRKYIVPYGLYRAEGYVSANLARKTTGFSEDDLNLLWTAILNMFENDHSAARGKAIMPTAASNSCCIQVWHLHLCDLTNFVLRDSSNFRFVRNAGTRFQVAGFLKQNCCRRSFGYEAETSVCIYSDNYRG